MAVVVNDINKLPARIAVFKLSRFEQVLSKVFMDEYTAPGLNTGVKRNNYYLLNTDDLTRFTISSKFGRNFINYVVQINLLLNILTQSYEKGFKHMLLTF